MFYKGSGGINSMFFEAICAARKSAEKHEIAAQSRKKCKKKQLTKKHIQNLNNCDKNDGITFFFTPATIFAIFKKKHIRIFVLPKHSISTFFNFVLYRQETVCSLMILWSVLDRSLRWAYLKLARPAIASS